MRRFYKIDPRLTIEKIDDVMKEPVVIRVNDFDEEDLEDFEEDLDKAHMTGQSVIPVEIDSYGGSAYGLFGMIAAIEQARLPVATILTSKAMSAGAVLFCFGTEGYRFMHPHSSLMIHDALAFAHGKAEEIKSEAAHIDRLNQSIYRRASLHIGKAPDYLMNLIDANKHADWHLTAKEAKKHNIANHLRIPSLEIEISLDVQFK